ncbi:thioesterase II family protein [Streptomyces angustmyceticus]|uniref:thioesterase II family protein n=1 Tax=Streptomyces angustmyceticus TaxID=285578 RepID=UPI0021AE9A7E|nr:alpha/beta fold hydrolase [Streptomyces angustmyceticus]BDI55437.1 thioesterase [Streptomyces sp.]
MALSSGPHSGQWLRTYQPVAAPRVRLVCFPHAGGSASFFRSWPQHLPADWEVSAVCYPGRETRMAEPALTSMAELAGRIADELAPRMTSRTVFFGHSMGASVAHEVAALLAGRGVAGPAVLLVSGRAAPHRLRRLGSGDDGLTDEELLVRVGGLGGPGTEFLQDPELRELFLPPIRADYRLVEAYAEESKAPAVDIPLVAYYGTDDPDPVPDDVRAWAELTSDRCAARAFPGGHFYLVPHEAELVGDIRERLVALG